MSKIIKSFLNSKMEKISQEKKIKIKKSAYKKGKNKNLIFDHKNQQFKRENKFTHNQ